MKTTCTRWLPMLSLAVALALPLSARAQPVEVVRTREVGENMLLFNAGDLLTGVINLEYERALGRWFGLVGGFSVAAYRGAFVPENRESVVGFGPEIGARVHFIRDAPAGLWLGPYLTGLILTSTVGGASFRPIGWGVGAAAGYNFVLGSHFVIQLGVGGGLTDYGDRVVWSPRFRLGLGGIF